MSILDLSSADWRKSSHSSGNGACVEVAEAANMIAVRDSKDPAGPNLVFTPVEWETFTAGVRRGQFDLA
jgi:predicted secreted Zn-dependent protease